MRKSEKSTRVRKKVVVGGKIDTGVLLGIPIGIIGLYEPFRLVLIDVFGKEQVSTWLPLLAITLIILSCFAALVLFYINETDQKPEGDEEKSTSEPCEQEKPLIGDTFRQKIYHWWINFLLDDSYTTIDAFERPKPSQYNDWTPSPEENNRIIRYRKNGVSYDVRFGKYYDHIKLRQSDPTKQTSQERSKFGTPAIVKNIRDLPKRVILCDVPYGWYWLAFYIIRRPFIVTRKLFS